ncbi:hypothetical protein DFA_04178 [Cavenderia fasciculata]|uniref:Uncharacterized protein n=1 Tax=Cavenderia fasciculata TaxID=261658 RepID=F4Q1I1_CACFS|nr:uncharacterized protein DFA_04178 [Cavenderia fasciculata]EGG18682.1 hypothetical protein DFA_04178 [Cavenderia fasciculata]|eukprot:XP_004366586.1 hypothetical protein DFA_04178 [Cavenderia fasciculata]
MNDEAIDKLNNSETFKAIVDKTAFVTKISTTKVFLDEINSRSRIHGCNLQVFVQKVISTNKITVFCAENGKEYNSIEATTTKDENTHIIVKNIKWIGGDEWITCKPFRQLLSDMGGLPRAIQKLLEQVYRLYQQFQSVYRSSLEHLTKGASSFLDTLNCSDIISQITWGILESCGYALINENSKLELPYILFWYYSCFVKTRNVMTSKWNDDTYFGICITCCLFNLRQDRTLI